MSDLISREKAIYAVAKDMRDMAVIDHPYAAESVDDYIEDAERVLKDVPSVGAVPKGMKWINIGYTRVYKCPECHEFMITTKIEDAYMCPNCRADMMEEENE